MNNIEHTLDMAANIKGAFAVAIVDYESGMTLGSRAAAPSSTSTSPRRATAR